MFPEEIADTTGLAPSRLNRVSQNSEEPDVEAVGRFDVRVHIAPGARTGEPIRLTVRTTSHLATRDAEIRLVLPEVESARMSEFGPAFRVTGQEEMRCPLVKTSHYFVSGVREHRRRGRWARCFGTVAA